MVQTQLCLECQWSVLGQSSSTPSTYFSQTHKHYYSCDKIVHWSVLLRLIIFFSISVTCVEDTENEILQNLNFLQNLIPWKVLYSIVGNKCPSIHFSFSFFLFFFPNLKEEKFVQPLSSKYNVKQWFVWLAGTSKNQCTLLTSHQ